MTELAFDVLIVDDDPIVVHAIEGALRSHCNCRVALEGQRAIELMLRRLPDIVLLDVDMPGMSGFEVLRVMREHPMLSQVPAVMVTGHVDERFHHDALEKGAVDFLVKPVVSSILLARVESHVRMGRAMRALRKDSADGRKELEATLRALNGSHQSLAASAAQLDEANGRLRQFVHIASHDLREPLNTVAQFAGLIRSEVPDGLPPTLDRYLDHVLAGASRMRVLLDDIVAYAVVQDGVGTPPGDVDLNVLMDELLRAMAGPIAASGARVEVGTLPVVRGVLNQLFQLFQCLLSNALKFHEPGQSPQIRVEADLNGGLWEVHVRDRGIGIDPVMATRVFQPFVRLHRKARFDGSGLGLSIAQEIARQHGSQIAFASTLGEGSDFWVGLKPV